MSRTLWIIALSVFITTTSGLVAGIVVKDRDLAGKELVIAGLRDELTALKVKTEMSEGILAQFQDSFREAREESNARQTVVLEALKQVEKLSSKNVALSNRLLAEVPQTEDLCMEANTLINRYLEEIQSENR